MDECELVPISTSCFAALTGLYAKPPPGSECSPAPSEASSTAATTSPAADIAIGLFLFFSIPSWLPAETPKAERRAVVASNAPRGTS